MNFALIFAGGVGSRMYNSPMPKQFIEVGGKSILIHTVEAFERNAQIDAIAVVCLKDWIGRFTEMVKAAGVTKVRWIVPEGPTGQSSICNGVRAIYNDFGGREDAIVLVSDGVRPIVSNKIIDENIACVKAHGSSVTVCPVPETIVEIEDDVIQHIPIRSKCYLSKAPQGFLLSELMEVHTRAVAEGIFNCTNSAELMRKYGHSLFVVYDNEENIKVTNPMDIHLMQNILKTRGI